MSTGVAPMWDVSKCSELTLAGCLVGLTFEGCPRFSAFASAVELPATPLAGRFPLRDEVEARFNYDGSGRMLHSNVRSTAERRGWTP